MTVESVIAIMKYQNVSYNIRGIFIKESDYFPKLLYIVTSKKKSWKFVRILESFDLCRRFKLKYPKRVFLNYPDAIIVPNNNIW